MKTEGTILSLAIYLTNRCNLHCRHCFLEASPQGKYFLNWSKIKQAIDFYRNQNYQIIEFTGGEACLSPFLKKSVLYAKKIGYPNIGINTNGISHFILDNFTTKELTKITFSLDGATSKAHDAVRGKGSFNQTFRIIKETVQRGFKTEIIFTVNKLNQHQIMKTIRLLDQLGVSKLSFNYISNVGNAKSNTQLLISPQEWYQVRKTIEATTDLKKMTIRYPLMFATPDEYHLLIKKGYSCILANSSKTEIRPNGKIYHCCLTTESPDIPGGKVKNKEIILDKQQEIDYLQKNLHSSCPARQQLATSDLLPICVYYKKIITPKTLK